MIDQKLVSDLELLEARLPLSNPTVVGHKKRRGAIGVAHENRLMKVVCRFDRITRIFVVPS